MAVRKSEITKRTQIFWSEHNAEFAMAKQLTTILDAKLIWVRLGSFWGLPGLPRLARQKDLAGIFLALVAYVKSIKNSVHPAGAGLWWQQPPFLGRVFWKGESFKDFNQKYLHCNL